MRLKVARDLERTEDLTYTNGQVLARESGIVVQHSAGAEHFRVQSHVADCVSAYFAIQEDVTGCRVHRVLRTVVQMAYEVRCRFGDDITGLEHAFLPVASTRRVPVLVVSGLQRFATSAS